MMTPEDAYEAWILTVPPKRFVDTEDCFKAGFLFGSHIAATEYLASKASPQRSVKENATQH